MIVRGNARDTQYAITAMGGDPSEDEAAAIVAAIAAYLSNSVDTPRREPSRWALAGRREAHAAPWRRDIMTRGWSR